MNRSIISICILLIICSFTITKDKGKKVQVDTFKKFADESGLKFDMPEGYKETYVKENKDLAYDFAIKNVKEDFEIRYTIWSLKSSIDEYKKCKLDTAKCLMVNPNNWFKGRAEANILNMTAGNGADIGGFDDEAVKKEFNADVGGSSFFELKCEFGKGYKFGQMIVLHKEDVADVIITYMSNDRTKHSDLLLPPFHALTFK